MRQHENVGCQQQLCVWTLAAQTHPLEELDRRRADAIAGVEGTAGEARAESEGAGRRLGLGAGLPVRRRSRRRSVGVDRRAARRRAAASSPDSNVAYRARQDAHRRHALVSVLRGRQAARRAPRRRRLQSRFLPEARRAQGHALGEEDHHQQNLRRRDRRLLGVRVARRRSRRGRRR